MLILYCLPLPTFSWKQGSLSVLVMLYCWSLKQCLAHTVGEHYMFVEWKTDHVIGSLTLKSMFRRARQKIPHPLGCGRQVEVWRNTLLHSLGMVVRSAGGIGQHHGENLGLECPGPLCHGNSNAGQHLRALKVKDLIQMLRPDFHGCCYCCDYSLSPSLITSPSDLWSQQTDAYCRI